MNKMVGIIILTISMIVGGAFSSLGATTFVYCSEGSPEGFNPSLYTSGTTLDATSKNMYNRLVEFEYGTTNVIPALATSWIVSENNLVYTFILRKGVKFHTTKNFTPTRDFNADDVLYSFNRQFDKNHPYNGISGGHYIYFGDMDMPNIIKSITKKDDYTVEFTLNKREAPFIANMAMDFASIGSAEYADAMMKAGTPIKVDLEPVATGPFQLIAYQKDAVIRYKAHPNYWKGKAQIDNLIFSITPDPSVRYAKLKAGECHLMPYPNPADIAKMKKDPNIKVLQQEGLNVGFLAYNTEKKPYTNPKVRKALNMAIDKQNIINAIFQQAGKVAKNPIPPTMWSYNEAVIDDEYNPEKAKNMLADAGFPNGFSTDIWAMPVQRPYNPNARRMAEIIQADWAKIGVRAKIVSYEWGEYLKRSRKGEHETVLLGWTGDNGDPDNFMFVLLGCSAIGGGNRARWCHKEFNGLLEEAKNTADQAERTKLYEQAQVVFKREAPWATIAHSIVSEPMSIRVNGFKIDPLGGHAFYPVSLSN